MLPKSRARSPRPPTASYARSPARTFTVSVVVRADEQGNAFCCALSSVVYPLTLDGYQFWHRFRLEALQSTLFASETRRLPSGGGQRAAAARRRQRRGVGAKRERGRDRLVLMRNANQELDQSYNMMHLEADLHLETSPYAERRLFRNCAAVLENRPILYLIRIRIDENRSLATLRSEPGAAQRASFLSTRIERKRTLLINDPSGGWKVALRYTVRLQCSHAAYGYMLYIEPVALRRTDLWRRRRRPTGYSQMGWPLPGKSSACETATHDLRGMCGLIPSDTAGNRTLISTGYFLSFFGIGCVLAGLGPIISALSAQLDMPTAELGFLFTARALGYLAGSAFGGVLVDRLRHTYATAFF
eukprot:4310880-Pleurochrysis_carterae.AAC.2